MSELGLVPNADIHLNTIQERASSVPVSSDFSVLKRGKVNRNSSTCQCKAIDPVHDERVKT